MKYWRKRGNHISPLEERERKRASTRTCESKGGGKNGEEARCALLLGRRKLGRERYQTWDKDRWQERWKGKTWLREKNLLRPDGRREAIFYLGRGNRGGWIEETIMHLSGKKERIGYLNSTQLLLREKRKKGRGPWGGKGGTRTSYQLIAQSHRKRGGRGRIHQRLRRGGRFSHFYTSWERRVGEHGNNVGCAHEGTMTVALTLQEKKEKGERKGTWRGSHFVSCHHKGESGLPFPEK